MGGLIRLRFPSPRLSRGDIVGNAVRLGKLNGLDWLALCEGIETGLAIMTAKPGLCVWACLSDGGLERAVLPPAARRILILADNDKSGTGLRAAERTKARSHRDGRTAVIAMPPRTGDDFNDLLVRDGPDVVRQMVEAVLLQGNETWN